MPRFVYLLSLKDIAGCGVAVLLLLGAGLFVLLEALGDRRRRKARRR